MANGINSSMWQHLTWCGEAWKPKHFFFRLALLCSQFTTLPNQLGLERKYGGQKIDPFDNLKGMLLHILISYEKKNMWGTNGEVFKNFKVQMKNDSHSHFFSLRKKPKTKPLQIYQSEIVDAWNFILLFPACIMVG